MKCWKMSGVLLCAVFMLAGCGGKGKIKVGVSIATMQESVYSFMKDAMFLEKDQDKVDILWLSADNNEANQASNVEDLITQKVNAVILHSVNTAAGAVLVKKIREAGVPVVAMDRLPNNAPVDVYVTADSYQVGKLQAEYLVKKINGKGNVIILEGEAGNDVARLITLGNKEVLKNYKDINIVEEQAHKNWARDLAMATVEDALTRNKNNIAGILANNSGMAMGAVQALKAQKLTGQVICIGSDADMDACQSIIDGELTADVDKKPVELGLQSYKAALLLGSGGKLDSAETVKNGDFDIKIIRTAVELITAENADKMTYRWKNLKLK